MREDCGDAAAHTAAKRADHSGLCGCNGWSLADTSGRLLAAMRARMGEVSEEEVRRAIAWVLKPRRRSGVLLPRPQATQDGREQS